jgi:hypothetical protein
MVYHSSFHAGEHASVCSCAILPLNTVAKGPAPPTTERDIIDEVLDLYRANVLFRNYDVRNNADKLLIYLSIFVTACLKREPTRAPRPWTAPRPPRPSPRPAPAPCPLVRRAGLLERKCSRQEADKLLYQFAHDPCKAPGEPGFVLGGLATPPASAAEDGAPLPRLPDLPAPLHRALTCGLQSVEHTGPCPAALARPAAPLSPCAPCPCRVYTPVPAPVPRGGCEAAGGALLWARRRAQQVLAGLWQPQVPQQDLLLMRPLLVSMYWQQAG